MAQNISEKRKGVYHPGLALLLATGLWLTGCAAGDPRLQGTWKSNKVPMPTELVKVTKMQTVRVRKGSRRTKRVPKTVTVAKTKSAPDYLNLIVKYERSHLVMEFPSKNGGKPVRVSLPYKVVASDEKSVSIDVREPVSGTNSRIEISFDGPNRYWVSPSGGEGWKEYYERIKTRG